jgi:endo-1,4-beta-xylanase
VSASTLKAHSGTQSLLVSGAGTGPAAIQLVAVPGATYAVTFWVSIGKVANAPINVTRKLTCSSSTTYQWVANHSSVPSNSWTQLSGSFAIDAGCASPALEVYAEGTATNVDLYVDDVKITKSR